MHMLIELKNVSYIYEQEPPVTALEKINLNIEPGAFIGLIGHTGSGKTTLVQLLNGLIKPTSGQVIVDGKDIGENKKGLKDIRRRIGLVFQYPEHQLFEETVYRELAFGPKNLGLDKDEIDIRIREALNLIGMDFDKYSDRSPFNLSGGQQRKIALAGVLAMKPGVLILDEPFAGLDPRGRKQLTELLKRLHEQQNISFILISHRMDEISYLATRILALKEGHIVLDGSPAEIFSQPEKLKEIALDIPQLTEILFRLQKKGLEVRSDIFDIEQAADEIIDKLRSRNIC